jgi:hypothetical protein
MVATDSLSVAIFFEVGGTASGAGVMAYFSQHQMGPDCTPFQTHPYTDE